MRELFVSMLKEEWRIHSSLFGSLGFALFPVLLTFLALAGALLWPLFSDILPIRTGIALLEYSYLLVGASVGAFGLFGREVMNRRFGQASLIAYSSRSLPVSEKSILFAFVLKDTVYYFLFWILPFGAGLLLAAPWIGISVTSLPLFLFTLGLSFLIGLSLVFLLSTLYVHTPGGLLGVLLIGGTGLLIAFFGGGISLPLLLPSLAFYFSPSPILLGISLLLIGIPIAVSILGMRIEYHESVHQYPNLFDPLQRFLSWTGFGHFMAKDALDLTRSEGGAGKIVFSFLFPVLFIWIALFVLHRFIPALHSLIVFSLLLGVVSSTIYNWVTEFDLFTAYTFLPVEVSTVISAKLRSYALLNVVSLAILFAAASGTGGLTLLPLALVVFVSVSFYAVAVTVYLTGLSPSIMLYNARVYGPYIALISPVLLFLLFVSIPNPYLTLCGVLCIPGGWYLLRKGFSRWNGWSQPGF